MWLSSFFFFSLSNERTRFSMQWLLSLSEGKKSLNTFETLFAGAVAGICSASSTYPLDMIRTRLCVQEGAY